MTSQRTLDAVYKTCQVWCTICIISKDGERERERERERVDDNDNDDICKLAQRKNSAWHQSVFRVRIHQANCFFVCLWLGFLYVALYEWESWTNMRVIPFFIFFIHIHFKNYLFSIFFLFLFIISIYIYIYMGVNK